MFNEPATKPGWTAPSLLFVPSKLCGDDDKIGTRFVWQVLIFVAILVVGYVIRHCGGEINSDLCLKLRNDRKQTSAQYHCITREIRSQIVMMSIPHGALGVSFHKRSIRTKKRLLLLGMVIFFRIQEKARIHFVSACAYVWVHTISLKKMPTDW